MKQQRLRTESSQVKREAEHFKNSVDRKRKKSKKEKEKPADESEDKKSKPVQVFQFRQRETEAQIRKRKREENVLTAVKDNSEANKKKTKKNEGTDLPGVRSVKVKSKRKAKEKSAGGRKSSEGVRSELLKSVFGGGGAS